VRRRFERCPFCAGHEDATPEAIAVYSSNQGRAEISASSDDSWQVRVIPNKFPALTNENIGIDERAANANVTELSFATREGYGAHEVIIESPTHTCSFSELTSEQAFFSFVAYRDRLAQLAQDKLLRYGHVFKNCRGAGGATLEHTHSQLLAMSIVPETIQRELQSSADYFSRHRSCILCEMFERELADGERIVAATPLFVAFCPFAGRFPYETWIIPREHQSLFQRAKLDELAELSGLIQKIIGALEKLIPQAPYNYWIHTSPFDTIGYDHYHWHLELIPRITTLGGFEFGSGCYVNDVLPEDAATDLRAAIGGYSDANR
jgi:UDPglucose--hexose-1-phosphate uridylyltransferase